MRINEYEAYIANVIAYDDVIRHIYLEIERYAVVAQFTAQDVTPTDFNNIPDQRYVAGELRYDFLPDGNLEHVSLRGIYPDGGGYSTGVSSVDLWDDAWTNQELVNALLHDAQFPEMDTPRLRDYDTDDEEKDLLY